MESGRSRHSSCHDLRRSGEAFSLHDKRDHACMHTHAHRHTRTCTHAQQATYVYIRTSHCLAGRATSTLYKHMCIHTQRAAWVPRMQCNVVCRCAYSSMAGQSAWSGLPCLHPRPSLSAINYPPLSCLIAFLL